MKRFGTADARSLLVDVIDWMLAPLAVLWPVSIAVSYAIGSAIADDPFDRELVDFANAVADEVRRAPAGLPTPLQFPVLERARKVTSDRLYVQVARPNGEVLAGDVDVPVPLPGACERDKVRLRNAFIEEGEMRIACEVTGPEGGGNAVVQVAELMTRRHEHATRVTMMVMGVVLVIVPIIVGLAFFAVYRGLRPVRRLREEILSRNAADLRPLPTEGVPEELAPLLKALNVQLERVRLNLAAQKRFVADAAHQLRTPLAALKTQSQVALAAQSLEEAEARLERIGESADHLNRLATQLLSLARADDAKVGIGQPVDLAVVLRVACHGRADAAIAKSIRLALEVPGDPVPIEGDSDLLHEMFVNLVDNAVRYTQPGGEVIARVIAGPGPVAEIEDNGPGVAEADRELVFERFHRTLGTGEPGSGLGLAIVKSIAVRHGAEVSVQAGREGRGALFRVRFPAPGKP